MSADLGGVLDGFSGLGDGENPLLFSSPGFRQEIFQIHLKIGF